MEESSVLKLQAGKTIIILAQYTLFVSIHHTKDKKEFRIDLFFRFVSLSQLSLAAEANINVNSNDLICFSKVWCETQMCLFYWEKYQFVLEISSFIEEDSFNFAISLENWCTW